MNAGKVVTWLGMILVGGVVSGMALAETNCEDGNGPLKQTQPQGMPPQEIIQKFAAHETTMREKRNNYTYTQDITVQTLEGDTVNGEFRQVSNFGYDDKGRRLENVVFAPQETL